MKTTDDKRKRYEFLKTIYDITHGSTSQTVQEASIVKKLGWDPKTTTPICDFLIDEKMIEIIGYGGIISISHKGVKEIKRALSIPKQATQYFPSIESMGEKPVAAPEALSEPIISIKATLDKVHKKIKNSKVIDRSEKENLTNLIKQLSDALLAAEPGNQEAAEAVALSAADLVKSAINERPNKVRIEITKEGLHSAAQNLSNVIPLVGIITKEIIAST
ncbi:MAG: hypothetical protein JXA42_05380 [Anaerolineales bacterium]|nr:hypothetical protein [Anaerolineales bacterium]